MIILQPHSQTNLNYIQEYHLKENVFNAAIEFGYGEEVAEIINQMLSYENEDRLNMRQVHEKVMDLVIRVENGLYIPNLDSHYNIVRKLSLNTSSFDISTSSINTFIAKETIQLENLCLELSPILQNSFILSAASYFAYHQRHNHSNLYRNILIKVKSD